MRLKNLRCDQPFQIFGLALPLTSEELAVKQAVCNSVPKRWNQIRLYTAAAAFVVAASLGAWLLSTPKPAYATESELEDGGDAERGRLVFAAGDCASCHASPGQPDRLRLGGGLALASPYGTFRVPNISQDPSDGIGKWRTVDLANALLSGVSPALKHYYPAFPYPS